MKNSIQELVRRTRGRDTSISIAQTLVSQPTGNGNNIVAETGIAHAASFDCAIAANDAEERITA